MIKINKKEPQIINFIIRVLPQNEDFEISAPDDTLLTEIYKNVRENNLITIELESGEKIIYQMFVKGERRALEMNESLKNNAVKEGCIVLIAPNLVAG